jgi:AcrR family transcriptional regulator
VTSATTRLSFDDLPLEGKVVVGARRSIARWGWRRTSVDDIARDAALSRASVYRAYPGGKDAVGAALLDFERAEFRNVVERCARPTLDDTLVALFVAVGSWFAGHNALAFMLQHEQELVGPYLGFAAGDAVVAEAAAMVAPILSPFVDPAELARATDWLLRLLRSHLLDPSAFVALADTDSVRRLVTTFVLPALAPLPV